MKIIGKAIIFSMMVIVLASCNTFAPKPTETPAPTQTSLPTSTNTPQPTITPTNTPEPTTTPTATPTVEPATPVGPGFTFVRLSPLDGNLNEQLAAEVKKAKAFGQDPYVEFDATWCPCCKAIKSSLDKGNAMMVDAFQGVYVVLVDIDEWKGFLDGTGFNFDGIPVFFRLNDQGRSTGESIDGNAWGENIPENMAPPLKTFFQTH